MKNEKNICITPKQELLIWLLVLLSITFFIVTHKAYEEKNNNDYSIFMQDVDGLIVGSPVRMMGIQVGHITKIKPTNNELFVKFVLHDKDLKIPQGTLATVEFSGMAGSKSLELYLPNKDTYIDQSVQIITVMPPKRLHDSFRLLNEMFHKIGNIIQTSSSFSTKLKAEFDGQERTSTFNNTEHFIEYADKAVDEALKKSTEFGEKLSKYKK